jgi:hypothetical protein
VFGGQFSSMSGRYCKAKSIRIQFFIYSDGKSSYYNTRLISLELDEQLKNEDINDKNIVSFDIFKNMKLDERIPYYANHINHYDENINNITYGWLGIYNYNINKVLCCNVIDIFELIEHNINFKPNTYLLEKKRAIIEICKQYKDKEGFYHYFCVLMFDNRYYDDKPTILNKYKLYNIVKSYLSKRLIDVLGLWYDEATPPSRCIHFNVHIRSKLQLNYLYLLFNDWKNHNGKPHLSHMYDPLLGRLYLARNNRLYLDNVNNKYRKSKEIFEEAKKSFITCFYSNDPNYYIDFLNTQFDEIHINLDEVHKKYKDDIYNKVNQQKPTSIVSISLSSSIKTLTKVLSNIVKKTKTNQDKPLLKNEELINIVKEKKLNKEQLLFMLSQLDKE